MPWIGWLCSRPPVNTGAFVLFSTIFGKLSSTIGLAQALKARTPGVSKGTRIRDMTAVNANLFAYLALLSWPIVCALLFRTQTPAQATAWAILAGHLLLPVGTVMKLPMIPQFDKSSVPTLCAYIGCNFASRKPKLVRRKFGLIEVLLCVYITEPIASSLLNGYLIIVGGTILPGVGLYDGISAAISQTITILPFLVGRSFFQVAFDLEDLLKITAIAALAYSIPLLFEIRFSPQLHLLAYGYEPSNFLQELRQGGFRPMVFMGHGLTASLFVATASIACAVLWTEKTRILGLKAGALTAYLTIVLYLCKSVAALIYALTAIPLVRFTSIKTQIRVALCLVILVLVYPGLRAMDVFPTRQLLDVASYFDADREQSLQVRFEQEDALLNKAWQRPFFGWGRYGRNRVLSENWEGVGVDSSITDGRWVITFGQFGMFGFLAEFGLLAIPVFFALRALKMVRHGYAAELLAGAAIILAINLIDLLPNSGLTPFTWLVAGIVLGRSEVIKNELRDSPISSRPPLGLQLQSPIFSARGPK
jgi:hypothetical protein